MNLIKRIFGGSKPNPTLQWQITDAGEWVYNTGYSAYIDGGYKALPNVYAIISSIASKCSMVPFEIYKVSNKKNYFRYKSMLSNNNITSANIIKRKALDKVDNSDVEKLLLNPNSYQSYENLMWDIVGYKLLTGNSVIYSMPAYEGGKPLELHNIPSPLVQMEVKGTVFEPIFKYGITYMNASIDGDEVLHFKYWNPISGRETMGQRYWGQSPLKACERLIGRYRDADITQGFQFKNMGPAGMISGNSTGTEGTLTEEQAIAVQDRFRQQHQGVYKAGSILVTPSNLKWTSFGLSPVDLNIDGSKDDIAMELSNAFSYPIALLSKKNSTENNMIQARKALITDCVIPMMESVKRVFQHKLLPKFGDDLVIEFDYSIFKEMQEDINKLADTYMKIDVLTDNEKRAALGYDDDPRPEANNVYKSQGQVPRQDLGMGNIPMIDEEML